jgi:hypothetical protein
MPEKWQALCYISWVENQQERAKGCYVQYHYQIASRQVRTGHQTIGMSILWLRCAAGMGQIS